MNPLPNLAHAHLLRSDVFPRWINLDDETSTLVPSLFDVVVHCPRAVARDAVIDAIHDRLADVIKKAHVPGVDALLTYYDVDFSETYDGSDVVVPSFSFRPKAFVTSTSMRHQRAVLTCSLAVIPGRWRLSPMTWEEARDHQDKRNQRHRDYQQAQRARFTARITRDDATFEVVRDEGADAAASGDGIPETVLHTTFRR